MNVTVCSNSGSSSISEVAGAKKNWGEYLGIILLANDKILCCIDFSIRINDCFIRVF